MTFDERYRAIQARDRRFDGRFVTAVRTTGIYCRPSCPARTPKPANVEFFTTSAAAHLAGYRACKRCLPEAVPGSPEWNLHETTAARAMRLIADGVVEREGVGGLARRVGYSTRQLNRVLTQELGAGPLALARAQRAHNARQLIVATDLSFAHVAFAAGFSSIRQFNDTMLEVFALTPTELRQRARRVEQGYDRPAGAVRVRLAHREPIDVAGLFAWFAARAIPGVETATAASYARTLQLPAGTGTIAVEHVDGSLVATVRVEDLSDLPTALARVRRAFDLDADPHAVDTTLAADDRLAAAVAGAPGVRIPGVFGLAEGLARSILGQQVSVAAARTQLGRLADALGGDLGARARTGQEDDGLRRLFPAPDVVADRAPEVIGGPRARIDTLVRASAAVAEGRLALDVSEPRDSFTSALRALPGIGPWTADLLAMRYLQSPDVLLASDLAVRAGARALGLPDVERALTQASSRFAPWRSYLTVHLWRAAAGGVAPSRPPAAVQRGA